MNKPLLSIIVPTKDRYKYLMHLIDYVIELDNPEIEFVIQDNTAENDEILEFLSDRKHSGIKYFHTKEPLTIQENSDKAVLNSTGEYVCYIGDDDAFLPNIIEFVNKMKLEQIEVGIFQRPVYYWPDVNSRYKRNNKIKIPTFKECFINPLNEINIILKDAGASLLHLPRLYHGIVRRDTLNKIYKKCETYFPGPSPDMANGIALCYTATNVKSYDYPLIIAGTGFKRIVGNEKGDYQDLDKLPFLPKDTLKKWNHKIPYKWTNQTIFAQTIYQTLSLYDPNRFDEFNWLKFYSRLRSQYPGLTKNHIDSLSLKDQLIIYIYSIYYKMRRNIGRFYKSLIPTKGRIEISGNNSTVINFAKNIFFSLN